MYNLYEMKFQSVLTKLRYHKCKT